MGFSGQMLPWLLELNRFLTYRRSGIFAGKIFRQLNFCVVLFRHYDHCTKYTCCIYLLKKIFCQFNFVVEGDQRNLFTTKISRSTLVAIALESFT